MERLKSILRKLFCYHKLEYVGQKNGVHVHICKKCGKTVTEIL